MSNNRLSYYPGFDAVKFAMACVVVACHTLFLFDYGNGSIDTVIEVMANAPVPYFFVVSGFLCYRGMGGGIDRAESGTGGKSVSVAKRMLTYYFLWTLLYLPLTIFGSILSGDGFLKSLLLFSQGTLFVGENYFSWPLWYLLAAAVAFALIGCLQRRGTAPLRILAIAGFFLLMGFGMEAVRSFSGAPVFLSAPVELYYRVFGGVRNGLFEGFFYVALGMCLGLSEERVRSIGTLAWVILACAGFAGCFLWSPDAHLPFCVALSVGVFGLSMRVPSGRRFPLARSASTAVYLLHMYFVVLFAYGFCGAAVVNFPAAGVPAVPLFLFVLVSSVLAALLVRSLGNRIPSVRRAFMC